MEFTELTNHAEEHKEEHLRKTLDTLEMLKHYRDKGERVDEVLYRTVKDEIETLREAAHKNDNR